MATASADFVDYFAVLGLATSASEEEISQRIKEELRIWVKRTEAPDLSMRQQAERRVQDLTAAKRILLDKAQRERYEAELRATPPAAAQGTSSEAGGGEDPVAAARRHLEDGDIPSAVYVASRATERRPGDAEAWATLAQAKLLFGRSDDALYEYRKAVELRPNHAPYYAGLAGVQESRRDWSGALQSYEMASRIDPSVVFYRVAMGAVLLQANQPQRALPILEAAHKEAPDLDMTQHYLATALYDSVFTVLTPLKTGRWLVTTAEQAERAHEMLNRAQSLNFKDGDLRKSLATAMDEVRYAQELHWGYSAGTTVKVVLGVLVFALIVAAGSALAALVVLAGLGVWIYFGRKPGWKLNAQRSLMHQLR